MQAVFGTAFVVLVSAAFIFTSEHVATLVDYSVQSHLENGGNIAIAPARLTQTIVDEAEYGRMQLFALIVVGIIVLTVMFAYLITRMTLRPMRGVLAAQKQFIGNIAHELRTPLSIIKTNTEIQLLDPDIKEDVKNTMISNVEELDRISGIINNLLTLTNLIRPERMAFTAVDLSHVARAAIDTYAELAKRRKIHVMLHEHTGVHLRGNATAVQQIADNILKNAIMYTPHNGRVDVSVKKYSDTYAKLTVADSGIGIARKDLQRIFDPFYRADLSRVRRQGGSGLGLTIASELVKLHGGTVTAQSEVGKGTTVTVLLPTVRQTFSQKTAEQEGQQVAMDFSHHTV